MQNDEQFPMNSANLRNDFEEKKIMKEQIFKDQVAIVTGAGEGIGHEIARQLALQGAAVLLNDIKAELATKAAQDICT